MNKSGNKYIKSTCACIKSLIEGDKFHENEKVYTHPNSRYTFYLKFDAYSTRNEKIIISSAGTQPIPVLCAGAILQIISFLFL